MTTIDKNKLDRFKEWNKLSQDSMNYAVERFDLLVIAIGTTGIIIALNVLKASLELNMVVPIWIKWIIKASVLSFAASIICNFYSQLSSKKAFALEKKWSQEVIYDLTGESSDEAAMEQLRKDADKLHGQTTKLNRASTFLLGTGFVLLAFVLIFIV